MQPSLRYTFHYIHACNMCGSPTDTHPVLGKRLNQSQGKTPWKKIGITTTICQCTSCGLIYSNPMPVPVDIQDHYGVPPEGYWKPSYFVIEPGYFQEQLARLKKLIEIKPGMKSLDIGAGLGKAMIAMTNEGFDTHGFEPSKPFYERALSKMNIASEKLKQGMLEDMEYPENEFDFITFGAVLEHLYNPSTSIQKALQWLKPGGIIHIEVPSSRWLINRIINFYYWIRGTDYAGNISPMHEPFHLYEFDLKSFQQHAQANQYEITFHEYFVCNTYMPKVLDLILKPYMRMTNTGMQLSIWLRKKK